MTVWMYVSKAVSVYDSMIVWEYDSIICVCMCVRTCDMCVCVSVRVTCMCVCVCARACDMYVCVCACVCV